jgi:predicted transcriptional regulator
VLFELSSNRRANILFKIEEENLKMRQIAKSLDMTVTETFRHLQRLAESKLAEKKVDGTYAITSLGRLSISFLSSFNFILRNSNYFLEPDVSRLPYEFVNRVGELSAGEFCGDTLSALNRTRRMVYESEEFILAMAEQSETSHTPVANEKVSKGLKLKFLMQKDFAKIVKFDTKVEHLKERRYMEQIPVTLLINEKEAAFHLRKHDGKMEYIGFFGRDEKFRK